MCNMGEQKIFLSAAELYLLLCDLEDGMLGKSGLLHFIAGGITIPIKSKDPVGTIMQEWLGEWLNTHNIYHASPPNSQKFPDFFLSQETETSLLEVKSFQYSANSPGFDIANFESYCDSLVDSPWNIDANYLIFGYGVNETTGETIIEKIWLKKIWEITGKNRSGMLTVQKKRGVIYNIRPKKWYEGALDSNFSDKFQFLQSIKETLDVYPIRNWDNSQTWLNSVTESYCRYAGENS